MKATPEKVWQFEKRCRQALEIAQAQYMQNPNPETQREYSRALKDFADLVLRNEVPKLHPSN